MKFVFCDTAKIRRLYDIANILTSLDLIQKVQVTEIRGRKPAFKYIGPDIDSLDNDNANRRSILWYTVYTLCTDAILKYCVFIACFFSKKCVGNSVYIWRKKASHVLNVKSYKTYVSVKWNDWYFKAF